MKNAVWPSGSWGSYNNPTANTAKVPDAPEQWYLDLNAKDKKYWDTVGYWEGSKWVEFKDLKKEDQRARSRLEKEQNAASQVDQHTAPEKTPSPPTGPAPPVPPTPKPHPDAKYMKVSGQYAWFIPDADGNLMKAWHHAEVEAAAPATEEAAAPAGRRGGTPAQPPDTGSIERANLGGDDNPQGMSVKQNWDLARVLDWVLEHLPKTLEKEPGTRVQGLDAALAGALFDFVACCQLPLPGGEPLNALPERLKGLPCCRGKDVNPAHLLRTDSEEREHASLTGDEFEVAER